MKASLWCGAPLEKATRYVGMVDVIFGMGFFAVIFLHLNEVKDNISREEQSFPLLTSYLPYWLSLVIVISHVIRFLMGVIIYIGALIKSQRICRIWLVVSVINFPFAFPTNLLYVYGIIVVYQFLKEMFYQELNKRKKPLPVPQTIDDCIPKGENNNPIDGKYIGFGNTTLPGMAADDQSDFMAKDRIPAALLPPSSPLSILAPLRGLPPSTPCRSTVYSIDMDVVVNENKENWLNSEDDGGSPSSNTLPLAQTQSNVTCAQIRRDIFAAEPEIIVTSHM